MRVLVCHPGAELYGSDRMAVETVVALLERGHSVTVAMPTNGPLAAEFDRRGAHCAYVRVPVIRKTDLRPLKLVRLAMSSIVALVRLFLLLRRAEYDIVMVNTIIQPIWLVSARLAGCRVVCHVREAEDDLPWILRKMICSPLLLTQRIIANSRATRRFVASSFVQLEERMEIVYNGKEWFSYFSSLRTAICGNEPRLVLVGRLSPRKGQDVALEAVRLLTEDGLYPSITFVGSVFDGYEWYASELTAAVRRYGLERQCSFVGFAEDVRPFLEEADIALVPSRTEPFGTVALEAMAAGRPVIASDVQGLSEIVQHRETGILVPPGDAVALSSAIHSLAMNSEMCSRLACQGLRRVRKDFSLEAYRESIVRLVEGAAR